MPSFLLRISILVFVFTATALSSGSSPMGPPRPGSGRQTEQRDTIDNSKYALGKSIFTGKARLTSNPRAAKLQRLRLEVLNGRVALHRGTRAIDLKNLAGRLTEAQLDALEYYVSRRYGTK